MKIREKVLLLIALLGVVSFTPERLVWSPSDSATSYTVRSRPLDSSNFTEFSPTSDTTFPLLLADAGRLFSVSAANAHGSSAFSNEVLYSTPQAIVTNWPNNKVLKFKLFYTLQGQSVELEWRQTNLGVDTGWRPLTQRVDYFVNSDTLTLEMSRVANAEVTGSFTNTQSFRARLTYDGVSGNYAYPPTDFKFVRAVPLDIERIEVIL